jgi:hypothetical protein
VEINGEQAPAEEGQGRVNNAGTHGEEGRGCRADIITEYLARCWRAAGFTQVYDAQPNLLAIPTLHFLVRRTNTTAMVTLDLR